MMKTSLENKFSKKDIEKLVKDEKLIFIKRVKEKEEKKEILKSEENVIENAVLNEEQQKVRDEILNSDKKYFLIKGITGSGKTEIYINLKDYFTRKSEMMKTSLENKFSKKDIEKLVKDEKLIFIKRVKEKEEKKEILKSEENVIENAVLNEEQQKVRDEILNSDKKYFLIKGITGSGKTEIYINLVREALLRGKGSLFLVPEISLTPQMVERFKREFNEGVAILHSRLSNKERGEEWLKIYSSLFLVPEISLTPQMVERFKREFNEGVAILHSRLSNKERGEEWLKIYSGEKKVVLGVRSAVFAPVKNLEYIIIDEEHEGSYKQDSSPIYNAKFVALRRAGLENCKVILGSATPSVESYYYGKKNIFKLLSLETRYNNAVLPDVEIVD